MWLVPPVFSERIHQPTGARDDLQGVFRGERLLV